MATHYYRTLRVLLMEEKISELRRTLSTRQKLVCLGRASLIVLR